MTTLDLRAKRIPIELQKIKSSFDNHKIICDPVKENDFTKLQVMLPGPADTPYENGKFKISIEFSDHYPFSPPIVKFITPIYHPNIDTCGKICLDILRMPPNGSYCPALTLESILISIQLLLASPNPDDPLQGTVADVYKNDKEEFHRKAKEYTEKYANEEYEPERKKSKMT